MIEPRIPDIILERFRLNELSADEAARIEALADREPSVRARLDALARSDEDIRRSGVLRGRQPIPAQQPVSPGISWWIPAWVVVTVILMAVLVVPRSPARIEDRIKGLRPALTLYRQTPTGSESLADGAIAR